MQRQIKHVLDRYGLKARVFNLTHVHQLMRQLGAVKREALSYINGVTERLRVVDNTVTDEAQRFAKVLQGRVFHRKRYLFHMHQPNLMGTFHAHVGGK